MGRGGQSGELTFLKDAKKTGPAAGECRIDGAVGIEQFFYVAEAGMQLEDRGFKVIDQLVLPGVDGVLDHLADRGAGCGGGTQRKGLGCADVELRIDKDEVIS